VPRAATFSRRRHTGWQKVIFHLQAGADEEKSADAAVQRGLRQRSDVRVGVCNRVCATRSVKSGDYQTTVHKYIRN